VKVLQQIRTHFVNSLNGATRAVRALALPSAPTATTGTAPGFPGPSPAMIKAEKERKENEAAVAALTTTGSSTSGVPPSPSSSIGDDESALYRGGSSVRAFVEFRTVGASLSPLIRDIEKRAPSSEQYTELLAACHQCYYQHRHAMLYIDMERYINYLGTRKSLPALTRSACGYLMELCTLEYQLFQQFFSTSDTSSSLLK
jgi:hypothetical protein